MMSKSNIAYHHHFASAAATIASPLPSPAMSLNDCNPWANIAPQAQALAAPSNKDLATPSIVYPNTQPTITYDGSDQPKNVINDVFLSSTMLYDDSELYSSFDSDSDSGSSIPSQNDDEHSHCFSTPMTPMSSFMENDTEDRLYVAEEDDVQAVLPEQEEHVEEIIQADNDASNIVVDMKRPMFIPVSICDPRDFAAMASLPTPPECNARKHSYDFLSNSDAFLLGGISSTKRRRTRSVDSDAPASPPASLAGDDETAELSDTDSSAGSFMSRSSPLFQMRHVRHLTPTSPCLPEIVCFAPPTHEEYDYHPELDRSDDEEDEEEEEESKIGEVKEGVVVAEPADLFVVEADQELIHNAYLSEDNYSSSDDEAEFSYDCENEMQIDTMSSSDDSDSDLSDVEDIQFSVGRRGTWHGPSLEERAAKKNRRIPQPPSMQQPRMKEEQKAMVEEERVVVNTVVSSVVSPSTVVPATPASFRASSVKKSCESKGSKQPTLFQILTKASIDWCRYCGTTEGVNWRPGPWGKRTLCNKHGCDFKGYGFACKLPRLDLTSYAHETVDQRIRPVLQHFCHCCQSQESAPGNVMVRCEGCPKAFHQNCYGETPLSDEIALSDKPWFCDDACRENVKKRRVCVELPKKRLPLMSTPKPAAVPMANAAAGSAAEMGRARGVRTSLSGETSSSRSK